MFEKMFTFDIEVYKHYFLFVAKEWEKDNFTIIDTWDKMYKFWEKHKSPEYLWIGYNSHHYDVPLIQCFLVYQDFESTYNASNHIINDKGKIPYEIRYQHPFYCYDAFTRVVDNAMAFGVSLKTLEGYMGVPIEEDHVDFHIGRRLTENEKYILQNYCKYDVIYTEMVTKIQNDLTGDLDSRIELCKIANNPNLINFTKARAAVEFLQRGEIF